MLAIKVEKPLTRKKDLLGPIIEAATGGVLTQVFSYEFCKIFKNTFSEYLRATASAIRKVYWFLKDSPMQNIQKRSRSFFARFMEVQPSSCVQG